MIEEKILIEKLLEKAKVQSDCMASLAFNEAARMVQDMPKVGEWIPVSERLPEEDGDYLIYDSEDRIYIPIYRHGCWITDSPTSGVLAWMPLPDPYKGE